MKISLMAAVSENGVIGSGKDIPWKVKGEQLLFKAMTYNHWLIVGRVTFETMGKLPNRKYAVITRSERLSTDEDILYFKSTKEALADIAKRTEHVFIAGGEQIYRELLSQADTLHITVIHEVIDGDVLLPEIPERFIKVFEQHFKSNVDYTYQIWNKG